MITTIDSYRKFINHKTPPSSVHGFKVKDSELNQSLFDFQKYAVQKALYQGRYALLEDCGLGKTWQQIEWAFQIVRKHNKPVLIMAPLGVTGQTIKVGTQMGLDIKRIN